MIAHKADAIAYTARKQIENTLYISEVMNTWLLELDQKTLLKALIYSGYTECSYLSMAWEDYSQNKMEFLRQWCSVLNSYYRYLHKQI